MSNKQGQQPCQTIDFEQLRNDPNSFLSLHFNDPVLRKLEIIRLYRAGFVVADIAKAFGFTRPYLYEMYHRFETEGTMALINKNWGSAARKLTTEQEAVIIRAKAINPEQSDADLAQAYGVNRTTVYRLLKEHGIQDLHKIIAKSFNKEC